MKLFIDPDHETWFPQNISQEERAALDAVAANAENLSRDDLQNAIKIMTRLAAIDEQKAEAVARREAIAKHYRDQERRDIEARVRQHDMDVLVKRQRIAQALGIDISEVPKID